MAESSKSHRSLAGWTMVDSKGEVVSDDARSESSDSSVEIVNLSDEDSSGKLLADGPLQPKEQIEQNLLEQHSVSATSREIVTDEAGACEDNVFGHLGQQTMNDSPLDVSPSLGESFVERVGGLGACCEALMENQSTIEDHKDMNKELEHSREERLDHGRFSFTAPLDPSSDVPSHNVADGEAFMDPHDRNSDSDSDFVQLDEDNLEEFEAEIAHNRNNTPNRSPSIAEGFNFLGPQVGAFREELAERLSDDDLDYNYRDFNEDTESSAEDIGDDRIESDQSEVGSVNTLTDVGDLSTFADIGDLPLVAGDVARNYRHRPNNFLSTVLNITLVVVTILTMGISIGLIMATDLEIEEWQNAYSVQVQKISSLEWTLGDMDKALQASKGKINAYESVTKSLSKAGSQNDKASRFFDHFVRIVESFESCSRKHGSLSAVDCHAQILPSIQHSLLVFKEPQEASVDVDSSCSYERNFQIKVDEPSIHLVEKQARELEELQQNLGREQERALHWQTLYLLERRQREWERENEDLEDKRDRARWEKEDEEEDRRDRAKWEKEDEEEDRREREKWEREEAENDRKERLLWEQEEQEEDKRDRERWEKERAEMDSVECLKKLMSTDFGFLKQHVASLNASAFNDFVNMSSLVSGIAKLRQSVLLSVQQIWAEAEGAINKMTEDIKNGRQSYIDTTVMADYLKQALTMLQSQFNDVVNVDADFFNNNQKSSDSEDVRKNSHHQRRSTDGNDESKEFKEEDAGKEKQPGMWNKAIKKIFKKTSKSLRKFVRTVATSWIQVKDMWEKKATVFEDNDNKQPTQNRIPLPSWLPGKACHFVQDYQSGIEEKAMVEIGSPCLWDVRDGWNRLLLNEPCDSLNRYSLACNVDSNTVWRLRRDLKVILENDEELHEVKIDLKAGKNLLHTFEEFWRNWGSSELLLKSDKDWAFCRLKVLSNSLATLQAGKPVYISNSCGRLVSLWDVLQEIEDRKLQLYERSEKSRGYFQDDVSIQEVVEEEEERDNKEENHRTKSQEEFYDDGDDDAMEEDFENEEFYSYGKLHDSNLMNQKSALLSKSSSEKMSEIDRNDNNSSLSGEMTEEEYFEQMAWYLKRAQHRIQMRRAQEKQMWLFDISHHREEMRKEHAQEKISARWLFDQAGDREAQRKKAQESDWLFDKAVDREIQRKKAHESDWLFDQAVDREIQRKKAHESDWLFERAHHRREEFKEKGRGFNNAFKPRQVKDAEASARKRKMEDVSQSDWLLQREGNQQRHQGGRLKDREEGMRKKKEHMVEHSQWNDGRNRKNKSGGKKQFEKGKKKTIDQQKKQKKHRKAKRFRESFGKKSSRK